MREAALAGIVGHDDWLALDRGTLAPREAVARAAARTGLPEAEVARFMDEVPPSLAPIPGTVDLMYRLKACGHRLYCLSNMQHASIEYLERAHGFWEVFTGRVVSCRVGICKPEPAIYSHLLRTYDLAGEQVVFVDDLEANLAAAARFGIRTIRFTSPTQCTDALTALGCL